MNERTRRLAAAALLGLGAAAVAAEPEGGLSLAGAVELAGTARLSLRIADARIEAARARVAQSQAQHGPSFDFVANVDRTQNFDRFTGITGSVEIPQIQARSTIEVTQDIPPYQTGAALQARYDLYTGGRTAAQLDRSEIALQLAMLQRQSALQDLALEVGSAYFRLRQACERQAGASRRLEAARRTTDLARARLEQGRIAEIEHSAAVLALAEARSELRTRETELDDAQSDFAATLRDVPAALPGPDRRCRFAGSVEDDLAAAQAWRDDSVAVRYHTLRLEEARRSTEIERAASRPQLAVVARYGFIGRGDASVDEAVTGMRRKQASVSLQLSYNLFDGGLVDARVAEAGAEVERRRMDGERAVAERDQARRRNEARVRLSENRVELAAARLDLARAHAKMAADRLRAGTGNTVTADEQAERERDASDELTLAQLDLALARLGVLFPAPGALAASAP